MNAGKAKKARLTVQELIEKLKERDPDLPVVGPSGDESLAVCTGMEVLEKSHTADPWGLEEGQEYLRLYFG
jgi:hypothetical protein